jgi:tetratricopeptide (TPR) repeat protein
MSPKSTFFFSAALILFIASCRSFDSISEERDKLERSRAIYLLDTTHRDRVDLSYTEGATEVNLTLFLDDHEFELTFDKERSQPLENKFNPYPSVLKPSGPVAVTATEPSSADLNRVLDLYQQAQTSFYNDQLNQSLTLLDSSLAVYPTTNAYALKGSIMFTLNEPELAIRYWNEAKKLDPSFEIPTITRR